MTIRSIRSMILRYIPLLLILYLLMLVSPIQSSLPRLLSLQSTGIFVSFAVLGLFFIAELIRTQKYKGFLFFITIVGLGGMTIVQNIAQFDATVAQAHNYPLQSRASLDLEALSKDDPQRQIRNLAHTLYQLRPYLQDKTIWVPDQPPLGSVYWPQYALSGEVKTYLPDDDLITSDVTGQAGINLPIDEERRMVFYPDQNATDYVLLADEANPNLFHLVALDDQNRNDQ